MIVSASYKTDIPAHYGRWFLRRLAEGRCIMVNPYSRKQVVVSLAPRDVDGYVFWTRNAVPFLDGLAAVASARKPAVVQFTVTGLPRFLEKSVPDADATAFADWVRDNVRAAGPKMREVITDRIGKFRLDGWTLALHDGRPRLVERAAEPDLIRIRISRHDARRHQIARSCVQLMVQAVAVSHDADAQLQVGIVGKGLQHVVFIPHRLAPVQEVARGVVGHEGDECIALLNIREVSLDRRGKIDLLYLVDFAL